MAKHIPRLYRDQTMRGLTGHKQLSDVGLVCISTARPNSGELFSRRFASLMKEAQIIVRPLPAV